MLTFHNYVALVKEVGKLQADEIFDSMLEYFSSCGDSSSKQYTAYKRILYGSI